jgi:hypothetical protein
MVPKRLTVTVSVPVVLPTVPDSDEEGESPPPPMSPKEKSTIDYNVIVHLKYVIDRGPFMMEDTAFALDENKDLSRKHKFKTWRGNMDGTGPGVHGEA